MCVRSERALHFCGESSRDVAVYAEETTSGVMVDHHIDGSDLWTKCQAKQRFRWSILNSWRLQCAYCGKPGDTLDHVRPRSRGGRSDRSNLVCCCATCNRLKGSTLDWRAWFRQQNWWCPQRETAIQFWVEEAQWEWGEPSALPEAECATHALGVSAA